MGFLLVIVVAVDCWRAQINEKIQLLWTRQAQINEKIPLLWTKHPCRIPAGMLWPAPGVLPDTRGRKEQYFD